MRDDYLQNALKVVQDPNLLVNLVSTRVKQLRRGARPLVSSLEKLSLEDFALREIAEGKISYILGEPELPAQTPRRASGLLRGNHSPHVAPVTPVA